MYDVAALRQSEFPITQEFVYFHNAGVAPLPTRTKNKMQWATEQMSRRSGNFFNDERAEMTAAFQKETAVLINAASGNEIVPTASTSTGLNAIAQAIDWQAGDNILLCDIEFPANVYPWLSLARDGVAVKWVTAVNGGLTLEALKEQVDENTRLVAASAIQFFTGHCTDLAAIGAFCHENNILFVVDAIQAIGHMPIDVQAMHIDALVTGGQKSLLASPGCGFMYVHDAWAETLHPRIISGSSTENFLHWLNYDLTLAAGAQRFRSGTANSVGMYAVLESVRLLQELGVANIGAHTRGLTAVASQTLTDLGYEVITPRSDYGPITTFRTGLDVEETDKLVSYLRQHNITVVKHLDREGTPHIRASFHCYNTEEEIGRFGAVVERLA
ncbi:MAG: aminotransferase class V-fold PLP-dependent enzyme [Ardenticatenaceae bacterium]|nr:aminotransferase class V-fold PLP-dependent enzyme [Ardenticatenaceae bacterium]